MRRIFLIIAIILPFVLVIGVIYWYFVIYQKPTSQPTPGITKPTPAVGFGSLNPYAKLCASFQNLKYEISCEKAVSLALSKAQGKAQKVSIGSVRTVIPGSNPLKRGDVELWLIDIKLHKPYFDTNFKKEVKVLRIGIGLQQHWGFYKQVLE